MIVMKEKDELQKKKRQWSREEKRDTWTVIAILASVMLVAILLSFLKSGSSGIENFSKEGSYEQQEEQESAKNILYGAGIICAGIIVIYMVKREKKRKVRKQELREIYDRQQKLEAARVRVEKARRLDRLQSERESIGNRRGRNERLGGQDYLEQRQREYKYYMEKGDDDADFEVYYDDIEEYLNDEGGIKGFIRNNSSMLIIAGSVIAFMAIAIIVFNIIF